MFQTHLAILAIAHVTPVTAEQAEVHVPGVGRIHANLLLDGTVEALGIPFGMPAVGERRFRAPEPVLYEDPDNTAINATRFGNACVQVAQTKTGPLVFGSEDCLVLNVWAPKRKHKQLIPVFFWIHGGAFMNGDSSHWNGSALVKKDVIVVSVNYRMNVFGFFAHPDLATETPRSKGNGGCNGLQDQILGLQWVRDHIEAFGGDPDKITIAGESAGASSVYIHLHSPRVEGMFMRGIIESSFYAYGYADYLDSFNATHVLSNGPKLMEEFGVRDLNGLRGVSKEDLILAKTQYNSPVADGYFLTDHPLFLPILYKDIDIVIGGNSLDIIQAKPFGFWFAPFPTTPAGYKEILTNYFGPEVLTLYPSPASSSTGDDIQAAFFRVLTDVAETCPTHRLAQKIRSAGNPVHFYYWSYAPREAPWTGLAPHGFETCYVFGKRSMCDDSNRPYYNELLADEITSYWTSFMKTGVPAGKAAWRTYSGDLLSAPYLSIGENADGHPLIEAGKGNHGSRCDFFDRFLKAGEEGLHTNNVDNYNNFGRMGLKSSNDTWKVPVRVPAHRPSVSNYFVV